MRAVLWTVAGLAAGVLHASSVRWTVQRLRPGRLGPSFVGIWLGIVVRSVLVAGMLLMSLREGIVYALLSFAGFSIGRLVFTVMNSAAPATSGLWRPQSRRGAEEGDTADG